MEWMGKTLPRFTAGFQRQYARRRHFLFAHLRAYAIRLYIFWQTNYHMPAAVIPCSLTSGRMRYAPTIFGKQTIICLPPSFPVRLREGVCDTPSQFLAKNKIYNGNFAGVFCNRFG